MCCSLPPRPSSGGELLFSGLRGGLTHAWGPGAARTRGLAGTWVSISMSFVPHSGASGGASLPDSRTVSDVRGGHFTAPRSSPHLGGDLLHGHPSLGHPVGPWSLSRAAQLGGLNRCGPLSSVGGCVLAPSKQSAKCHNPGPGPPIRHLLLGDRWVWTESYRDAG